MIVDFAKRMHKPRRGVIAFCTSCHPFGIFDTHHPVLESFHPFGIELM